MIIAPGSKITRYLLGEEQLDSVSLMNEPRLKYWVNGQLLTGVLAFGFAVATAMGQDNELERVDSFDYLGHVMGRAYEKPADLIDEIKALEEPWNHLFTTPIGEGLKLPQADQWYETEVLVQDQGMAMVQAKTNIPDGIAATSASASGKLLVCTHAGSARRGIFDCRI